MASLNRRSGHFETRSAFRASLAAGGLLVVAVTAHAQTFSSPISQQTIPDNSTTGASAMVTVTATSAIASFTGLTITGLIHPYIGDLVASITHTGTNGTTTVDLFDHTGTNSPNNANYNYGSGSAAAFNGNYTFAVSGASLITVADGTTVPTGPVYQASGNAAGGFDKANAGNTLNSFLGQSEAGTWTLTIKDEQLDDTGSFTGFNFTVSPTPEPSQCTALVIGLLGLGGMALRARRRSAS